MVVSIGWRFQANHHFHPFKTGCLEFQVDTIDIRYAQIATCVKGRESFWINFFHSPLLWESIRQIVFRTLSSTWKWMVGRWSFPFGAKGLFSGRTVSFRGVLVCRCLETIIPAPRRPIPKVNQHHSTQVFDPANLVSPRKNPCFGTKQIDPTVFLFFFFGQKMLMKWWHAALRTPAITLTWNWDSQRLSDQLTLARNLTNRPFWPPKGSVLKGKSSLVKYYKLAKYRGLYPIVWGV